MTQHRDPLTRPRPPAPVHGLEGVGRVRPEEATGWAGPVLRESTPEKHNTEK